MTNSMPTKEIGVMCENCKKHPATENWLGQGSMMDYVHGNYQLWCKCCVLKEQIKFLADDLAAYDRKTRQLAELRTDLEKVKCVENS